MAEYKPTLKTEIKNAIKIAKDLGYPESVIEKIKLAESIYQISSILHTARKVSIDNSFNK